MKRSVSVTVVAVLSLLGSLLTLAIGSLMAIALVITGKSNPALKEPFAVAGMLVGMFFLIVPAIWGLATSLGLFRLKRWARLSILVFSVLLVLMGVFSAPMLLLIPLPQAPEADPQVTTYIRFGLAGFYALLAAIGIWWFILFTRRSVREQFGVYPSMVAVPIDSVDFRPPKRPISITVIAWLMIVGAAFAPFNFWLHPPIPFMWAMLSGLPAALYTGFHALLAVYVGIGLLRLKPLCRTIAIYLYSFFALNSFVFYTAPGRDARIHALMNWGPAFLPHPDFHLPTAIFLMFSLVGLGFVFVLIYFLVTSKPAFEDAPGNPASL
ncbi:MAG: hypothetical protein LAO30_25895 [Acidobacteriia bacterium]|nr:hypothetical protein [Terriglobia bacterium]